MLARLCVRHVWCGVACAWRDAAQGSFPYTAFEDKEFLPFLVDQQAAPLHSKLPFAADAPALPVVREMLRRCVTRTAAGRLTADEATRMSSPGAEWVAADPEPNSGYIDIVGEEEPDEPAMMEAKSAAAYTFAPAVLEEGAASSAHGRLGDKDGARC